jgi:hypothetical protein
MPVSIEKSSFVLGARTAIFCGLIDMPALARTA